MRLPTIPVAGSRTLPIRRRLALRGAVDRPVFVGGCPRSGTTLLGAMLHAHPDLSIPPETRFVMESYAARQMFGDLADEQARRRAGEWLVSTRSTRFAAMQLDAAKVVDIVAAAPPTIGSLSGAVLQQFAAAHGKARWGDKRPKYVELLPLLFRLFPDAQFIHLVRDPRGCIASLKRLGWWGWQAPEALDRWRSSIDAGVAARSFCTPDQYFELRYEDLVDDPAGQLGAICDFLGVSPSVRMLDHRGDAALINKAYHHRVARPVDGAAVDLWRHELVPEELALVQAKVGGRLDDLGYPQLTGLPTLPSDLEARYDTWRAVQATAARKSLRSVTTTRLSYRRSVSARLTVGQQRLAKTLP